MTQSSSVKTILEAGQRLSSQIDGMDFRPGATHVYNPLSYAWAPYARYVERWGRGPKRVLFLGMNPGPFGMAQTGVAFGEVSAVRDWIGVQAPVGKPPVEHPARPVDGFDCPRAEVSGQRLWGLFAERFGTPDSFFREHFVINYCPLLFLQAEGKRCRNLTPDKLPAEQTRALYETCDAHLRTLVEQLQAEWLVGVGKFAENRAALALDGLPVKIGSLLHPSPASPAANRGWTAQAEKQLAAQGIW